MTDPPENSRREFDLAERTVRFGEDVIRFARRLKSDYVSQPLVRQLIRSSTSIGANYCEAVEAGSPKEFRHRLSICKREARETQYWLRLLAVAEPPSKDEGRSLWSGARELTLIFAASHRNSRARSDERKPK